MVAICANHLLDTTKCSVLKSVPWVANLEIIAELFTKIDSLFVCTGHCDSHFVQMVLSKKEKKISPSGNIAACVDDLNTVRTTECELLCTSIKCASCKAYRRNLRAMYNRWSAKQSGNLSSEIIDTCNQSC